LPKRFNTRHLFYSYPAQLVAEWCCVSMQTAYHWKSGIRKPSAQALKLFQLHARGRILTAEWDGWGVVKGKLCDPEGNETTQGQLRAYAFVYQLAQEYGRTNPRADEVLQRLSAVHSIPKCKKSRALVDAPGGGVSVAIRRPPAARKIA